MKGEQQQKVIQGNNKHSARTPAAGDKWPRFCTAFGNKDAWAVSQNYGVATEG